MRTIAYINLFLFSALIASALFLYGLYRNPQVVESNSFEFPAPTLPKHPFPYQELSWDRGLLSLAAGGPEIALPDLSSEIVYLGKNHRPDTDGSKSRFYIAFGDKGEAIPVLSGEPLYLHYLPSGSYVPSNLPTPLWLQMIPLIGGEGAEYLEVKVYLSDEEKGLITSPSSHHLFTLASSEKKNSVNHWEVGGIRFDNSLLIRQGVRFTGKDLFFERHGGEEFKETEGRERIDFLAGDPYCCFVKEGDFLIWKEKRWQRALASEDTSSFPLLVIKKMDEKSLSGELWDVEGKNKLALSLPRLKNYDPPLDFSQEFKLVGVRTWVECLIECRGKRLLVKEGDWLVLTSEGWHKISSSKEVDDYVTQKLSGPLFILDKISKKNNRSFLTGHLFNALRTTVTNVEISNQVTLENIPEAGV